MPPIEAKNALGETTSDESHNIILKSLSARGHSPCVLLQLADYCVLVDADVDCRPLMQFLPCLSVECARLSSLPGWTGGPAKSLPDADRLSAQIKDCCQQPFIDATPELLMPDVCLKLSTVVVSSIDAVFISNSSTMLALPLLAALPGFRARVYASDATIQMGQLQITEVTTLLEAVQKEDTGDAAYWKRPDVYKMLPNSLPEGEGAPHWQQLYSDTSAVHDVIKHIIPVAVNEVLPLSRGVSVRSLSAGFCIGSLNWLFTVHDKKIGCLSSSSTIMHHSRPADFEPLKRADALIMTGLNQTPGHEPKDSMQMLCKVIEKTLSEGGNVLVPCACSGVVFDVLECVNDYVPNTAAMYWVSPTAEHCLAYSQIFSDWLAESKQRNIYEPSEPFVHSELLRRNRLRVYPSLSGDFSREFKSPALVFAGHSSLRFGDSAHLMDLWADDPANALVLIDPSYPLASVVAAWQPLQMRAYYCPIDTRLDFARATQLIAELGTDRVFVPRHYMSPGAGGTGTPRDRQYLEHPACQPFDGQQQLTVCTCAPLTNITLDSALGQALTLKHDGKAGGTALAPLHGTLQFNDESLTIRAADKPANAESSGVLCGTLNAQQLTTIFSNTVPAGVEVKCNELSAGCFQITCPQMHVSITIKDGLETHVVCEKEDAEIRRIIRAMLSACLQSLPK